jgi:hypothetical protein
MLEQQTEQAFTIITLCNYGALRDTAFGGGTTNETPNGTTSGATNGTTNGAHTRIDKKEKKDKNTPPPPPPEGELDKFEIDESLGEVDQLRRIYNWLVAATDGELKLKEGATHFLCLCRCHPGAVRRVLAKPTILQEWVSRVANQRDGIQNPYSWLNTVLGKLDDTGGKVKARYS